MTIESKIWPDDPTKWDGKDPPFYLELIGETSPVLDVAYAEVQPPGAVDGGAKTVASSPIYEYFWTIGHGGYPDPGRGLHRLLHKETAAEKLWEHLETEAAHVYVFFPLGGGWRVKELVATTKYLTPIREQKTLLDEAAKDWQHAQPAIADASQFASLAGPALGPVGIGAASALSAIAKVKVNSVPQVKGFEWSVSKMTFVSEHRGVMQGVMWELPKTMFEELGGRLTGSVAVSFVPDHRQDGDAVASEASAPQKMSVLAHAKVVGPDGPIWVPAENRFLELSVAPRLRE